MPIPLINIPKRQAYFFAAFLVMYEFLVYIANDMVMPAMISIVHHFNASETYVATSLTAYLLGGASLQPVLGPVSDAIGRRPVMLFGVALFFLMTIGIIFSGSINGFLWARYFQGMGLCFIGVIGYAAFQEIFDEMDAIRLMAIMANVAITAPLIGPLVGALFVQYASWQSIFVVNAFFCLISLWGLTKYMPETIGATTRKGHHYKPTPFKLQEILKNYKKIIGNPCFMSYALAIALISTPCLVWIALSPVILIHAAKMSVISYAIFQIPLFGACIVGNVVLQKLSYYKTPKELIHYGNYASIAGLLLSFVGVWLSHGIAWTLIPGFIIYFAGMSIVFSPLNRLVLFVTPVAKGTVSAVVSMMLMGIQSLAIEICKRFYVTYDNVLLSFIFLIIGCLYLFFVFLALRLDRGDVTSGSRA